MNKPRAPRGGCLKSLMYKIRLFFDPTEKVVGTNIAELDRVKLFVSLRHGRKIGTNGSKLGSRFQILIDPSQAIFGYENRYYFLCKLSFNRSP